MARNQNADRLNAIYQTVEEFPGERASFIAQRLGLNRSEVTRALPALEQRGYLLSEDDKGRLWPFLKIT